MPHFAYDTKLTLLFTFLSSWLNWGLKTIHLLIEEYNKYNTD